MTVPWRPRVLPEYSFIADGERGGLIGPDGAIVWMCAPQWDSPAVFSALLGGEGGYAVTPASRTARASEGRARSGEAKTASRSSKKDISSSRRGGLRSHSGSGGPTFAQLYNEARQRGIKGRSTMNKAQLARALGR